MKVEPLNASSFGTDWGKNLRIARKLNNRTQRELGEASGVVQAEISKLECGYRPVVRISSPPSKLERLAAALGEDIDVLFPPEEHES